MKYYSELLNKTFNTEKECLKAEREAENAQKKAEEEAAKKNALRKAKADEVDKAYKKLVDAKNEYQKVLAEFCKDYPEGYHTTISWNDLADTFGLFNDVFGGLL